MEGFVHISIAILYATCGYILYDRKKTNLSIAEYIVTSSIIIQALINEIDALKKELNTKTNN